MTTIRSQCGVCVHLDADGVCEAFPSGIPPEVMWNRIDHRQSFPGDNEVTFEAEVGQRHPLEVLRTDGA